jgi:hypothetical protein
MAGNAAALLSIWQQAEDPTSVQAVAKAAVNAAALKLTPSVEQASNMVVFINNLRTFWHFIPENIAIDLLVGALLLGVMIFVISITLRRIAGLGCIVAQISLFLLSIILLGWMLITLVYEAKFVNGVPFPRPIPIPVPTQQDIGWFGWAMGVVPTTMMETTVSNANDI